MKEQQITIPINSDIDLESLLEIIQSFSEELEDRIADAGFASEIDETEITVEYKTRS